MASSKRNRQKKQGMKMQLPSHVQININKEERLMQRNLGELERETRYRMRCIMQDQQVAWTKLHILQSRISATQKRSQVFASKQNENASAGTMSHLKMSDTSYFKRLMGPGRRRSLHTSHAERSASSGQREERKRDECKGCELELRSSLKKAEKEPILSPQNLKSVTFN